jgi:trehalose 6-phosphate phosphatase
MSHALCQHENGQRMQILRPRYDLDRFFEHVAAAPRRALLLDYDGTLAPFTVARDRAVPYPQVREVIGAILEAHHTRLAVISGRRIDDLAPLLGLDQLPEIWGSHGWERLRLERGYELADLDERSAAGLAQAHVWLAARGLASRCEPKPAGIALHWRGLDPQAIVALREQVLGHWLLLAQASGLEVHAFDGGIELRAPGRDKGYVVRTILDELGVSAAVAYLGDDLTDEDAFVAVAGRGLGVLVRPELRPTAAAIWLRPPEELLAFLWRWQRTCAGE